MLEAIERLPYSQKHLLRQQLAASFDSDPTYWLPALTCLHTAEVLGATRSDVVPAATALGLVEAAALVVDELVLAGGGAGVPPRGLLASWGMPRTLNAGDAFFALAQSTLLSMAAVPPDELLSLAAVFDEAVEGWAEESESLRDSATSVTLHPSRALLSAGLNLGARIAGVGRQAADRLALGLESGSAPLDGFSQKAISELQAALDYLAGVQP
jgi:hypothetical protein